MLLNMSEYEALLFNDISAKTTEDSHTIGLLYIQIDKYETTIYLQVSGAHIILTVYLSLYAPLKAF